MTAIIISYINPDLDGVACSLALEALERPHWSARILGKADQETKFVLDALSLPLPQTLHSWSGVDAIWLVDTHHPAQLPDDLPEDIVTRITDHHPGGSPEKYPRAAVENEAVGAAATLVTERFEKRGVDVPANIATLLQSAIVSNTLEFRAPASGPRDHQAYQKLARIQPANVDLLEGMRRIRRQKIMLETGVLLESDAKIFETSRGSILVAQIEAPGALEILSRTDLLPSLESFAASRNATCALLNVVDTEAGKSAVIGTDKAIIHILSTRLFKNAGDDGIIRVERVLQRKTDIVPFILM